ncbi:MAG: helix-turn-helix transcriptional regulator [Alphaproteobacteria bacterium]|nr:helix-turn-helix transcriptional regulator [Alphaproteobacteria bacterium]
MRLEVVLGGNVRRLRKSAGLSQEELAAEVGIDMRYLGGIERGQENPSLAVIGSIAKALSVSASSLLEAKRP